LKVAARATIDGMDMDPDTFRLAGATNFRSLGGLPTASGRRLRPHALMRADRLSGLSADDWGTLAGTGIATICDLRSDAERAEHPNRVPPQFSLQEMHCDIRNDLRADPALARLLLDDPSARGAERVMVEIYRRFPRYMGGTLSAIVDRLLAGGAPLLVHCSAGKDRTGFIIAMLLHALEVPEPVIRQDYLASRTWPGADSHRASLEARLGTFIPADELRAAVDTVLDVREAYFDAALEALDAEYGSIRRYFETAADIDPARLDLLRSRLLA
jgi:protein-tyrosine phosphatase